ncbi:hypothetical protein Hanom_Chr05g00465411 [Helianthus anomalus]
MCLKSRLLLTHVDPNRLLTRYSFDRTIKITPNIPSASILAFSFSFSFLRIQQVIQQLLKLSDKIIF